MKIGILDYLTESSIEQKILGMDAKIKCLSCTHENDLPKEIENFEGIMLFHHFYLSASSLQKMKSCKVLVRVGVGYDNVDYKAAGELGIPVVNVPDYGTNDVADHAFALMLSIERKLLVYNDALRADPIKGWNPGLGGNISRLTGTKLGIIGLGRIGTAFALRSKAFGMEVSFYDPYIADGIDKALQINRTWSLETLFKENRIISIHAPLTDETKGMINEKLFTKDTSHLTLLNVSRGEIVSTDAVYNALLNNRLKAFGADVLSQEPPDTKHPLIKSFMLNEPWLEGRVQLTPHSAFYAVESRNELRTKAAERLKEMMLGIPLRNCVNFAYLKNSRTKVAKQIF